MTVSSDILLSGTAAAPKAASRKDVSNDRGQRDSATTSVKRDEKSFKTHLAQEIKQPRKSPKTSPSPQQPTEVSSPVAANDKSVQNEMNTTEDTTQHMNMPAFASEKPNVVETKEVDNKAHDEKGHALLGTENSQGQESSNPAINIALAKENNGQEDASQKNASLTTLLPIPASNIKDNDPAANEGRKTTKADGIISSQDAKGSQASQNGPIAANASKDEPVMAKAPLILPQQIDASQGQEKADGGPVINSQPNSQTAVTQAAVTMADQAVNDISSKEAKVGNALPKTSSVQKASTTIADNPAVALSATEDGLLTQAPLAQSQLAQVATASEGPLPTIEQTVLASVQQVSLNDPTNEKRLKDGANENVKETTDKGSDVAASEGKKASAAGKKGRGSSQNSDKAISELVQNSSPKGSAQTSLLSKIPFVADLSQSLIAGDGKVAPSSGLQLPPGLLSVQEVGQIGQQTNSLNATINQIKHPMPPVTPQMLTKQISMSILKQAQNGQDSFRINLKPAELGQVDIRMDFHTDGKMTATVIVENDRTLALLQRDQGALQKALENAGFDAGGNNLNFSLKKQQQDHDQTNFASNNTEDGDYDDISTAPNSINSHQQMKMAYSDNALDINI